MAATFAAAICTVAVAAPDREQGMPIISTFLPSRYNTPESPVGPQAFALTALSDRSILAANNSGLLRLSGTGAATWNPINGNVLSVAGSAGGRVFIGGIGQIGYFDTFGARFDSLSAWGQRLGVEFGDFWVTVAARDGAAYFADSTHVFHWNGHELHLVYTGQPELLQGVAFGNGAVILDPGAGLVAIDGDSARTLRGSARLRSGLPCALAGADDGVVTVCSDGSVLRWRGDEAPVEFSVDARVRAELADAGITTAGVREDGSVLVGTRRAGVLWLDRDAALGGRLSDVPDWGDSRVFSLLMRRDEGFWVGLDYGVAHVEWPGQVTRYDALLGLPRAVLATLRVAGQLVAVTTRGVYRLVPASADQAFAHFEPYVPTRTTAFAAAQAGGDLFVASGEGVYAVSQGHVTQVDTQLAYAVFPLDAGGRVLLAGGLKGARVLRRAGEHWDSRDLVGVDTEIRHVLADSDGSIWLSGNYGGAFRLPPATSATAAPDVERFGTGDGLPPGRVIALRLPDGIAFNTSEGLMRFDRRTRRFVADDWLRAMLPAAQGETRVATPLDDRRALVVQHDRVRLIEHQADGTWRERFTPLARLPRGLDFRDVRCDEDGAIWIAGNEAVFRHRPELQSTLPALPRPRIIPEGSDGVASADGAVDLGTAPRNLRARFDEAFFVGVEQLRFRTRLEPLEAAWSDWQQSPQREITRLPGGSYRLAVQVRDIFGRESDTASIGFSVQPPWYLRWWAYALAGVALLALLDVLMRRRERRLRLRAEELAGLVRERTRELEHASITDALTGLRNRHYVQLAGTPWQQRTDGVCLLALADIDHFKRINDERGHAAGDEVLRAIGRALVTSLPADAMTVRWGGEEFLVIVPLADARRAGPLVRHLLQVVADCRVTIPGAPAVAVTCSIGWELARAGAADSLDTVLSHADRRLYAAKHAGRDRAHGPPDAAVIRRQVSSADT